MDLSYFSRGLEIVREVGRQVSFLSHQKSVFYAIDNISGESMNATCRRGPKRIPG